MFHSCVSLRVGGSIHSCDWRRCVVNADVSVIGGVVVVVFGGGGVVVGVVRFVVVIAVVVVVVIIVVSIGGGFVVGWGRVVFVVGVIVVIIMRVIRVWLAMAIEKNQTRVGFLTPGKKVHTVLDFVGHRKWRGVETIDHTTAVETEEVKASLSIPRGTKGESANGTWSHSVVVWLMSLYVLTEFKFAVAIVVNSLTGHNSAGAERDRDAIRGGKCVQPEHFTTGQLDNHS
jgi:hypothetical protein